MELEQLSGGTSVGTGASLKIFLWFYGEEWEPGC